MSNGENVLIWLSRGFSPEEIADFPACDVTIDEIYVIKRGNDEIARVDRIIASMSLDEVKERAGKVSDEFFGRIARAYAHSTGVRYELLKPDVEKVLDIAAVIRMLDEFLYDHQ